MHKCILLVVNSKISGGGSDPINAKLIYISKEKL